jgi:hypothetical protein
MHIAVTGMNVITHNYHLRTSLKGCVWFVLAEGVCVKIHSNRNFTRLEFIEFIALFPLGFHHIETREMAAKNLQNSNFLGVAIPRGP